MSRGAEVRGSRGAWERGGMGAREQGRGGAEKNSSQHPISPAPLPPISLARLRQGLYRLFGALFLYPDRDRIATLRAVAGELQQADDLWDGFAFSEPLRRLLEVLSELREDAKGEVEEEYVRLFLVKPIAPPYESFYLDPDGQARGWITVQLEREYADAGLALSPDQKKLPDNVAVELEFMAFLCSRQALALEEGALENQIEAQERQRAFLGQHLGRWFPQFARRVKDAARESLYGVVIEAAYAFLRHDLGVLQLRQGGSSQ